MDWRMDGWSPSNRVSPFRHLRIKDYLHLPAAFRSLSRLSSALSAKASTLRSFLLDYSILVIIALITFVTNFWSVTYYSLKNFTVITMSWSNRYLIILSFCMKFSKYISQQILFSSADNGDGEIRTLDPLLARQVLSQLSYAPVVIWQPPTFPYRYQYSIIGRLSLNHRVRDENGCFPKTHRHQKYAVIYW